MRKTATLKIGLVTSNLHVVEVIGMNEYISNVISELKLSLWRPDTTIFVVVSGVIKLIKQTKKKKIMEAILISYFSKCKVIIQFWESWYCFF